MKILQMQKITAVILIVIFGSIALSDSVYSQCPNLPINPDITISGTGFMGISVSYKFIARTPDPSAGTGHWHLGARLTLVGGGTGPDGNDYIVVKGNSVGVTEICYEFSGIPITMQKKVVEVIPCPSALFRGTIGDVSCGISGPAIVNSSIYADFETDPGGDFYHWTVTGSAIINGPDNQHTVNVFVYPGNNFTLILDRGACSSCPPGVVRLIEINSPNCGIEGPEVMRIGDSRDFQMTGVTAGWWTLANYGSTSASISGNYNNLNVRVSAGSVGGHFILYFNDAMGVNCSKHVYVDDPLPVELSAFTAAAVKDRVELFWTTSFELNNAGFDIERFSNGSWSKIGFIEGRGNLSGPTNYEFTDINLTTGKYGYRLKQTDYNGSFEYFELDVEVEIGEPAEFNLSQNYPNPFNPSTKIGYQLPKKSGVLLMIYDNAGREIKTLVNELQDAGYYSVSFSGSELASGIYYFKLVAGDFVSMKKMVLVK